VPNSGHCGLVHRTLWEVSYPEMCCSIGKNSH
jgi:hypothetical protein